MIKNIKEINFLMILRYFLVAPLVNISIFFPHLAAADFEVPVELQAKLFLTAFTYDNNLERREGKQLNIGILYFPEVSKSKDEAMDFSKALDSFKSKKVGGLSIGNVLLAYNGNVDLKNKILTNGINMLYVASGKNNIVKEVTKVAKSEKVLSFTGLVEYVTECGISMAVGLKANKPKIYLNLSSAKEEGADFSAKFLRIVEIMEE